jgi:hypothetical protein
MVSNIRHLQLNDPLLETKRHRMVIVNFPDSFCGIPFAARLFDTTLQLGFVEFNSQSDHSAYRLDRVGDFLDSPGVIGRAALHSCS